MGKGAMRYTRPHIIVPLSQPSMDGVAQRYRAWQGTPDLAHTDIIEWRVDGLGKNFFHCDIGEISSSLSVITHPIIATWRSSDQGGDVPLSEDLYSQVIRQLSDIPQIRYIDIELPRRDVKALVENVHHAGKQAIVSYHDFAATPDTDVMLKILFDQQEVGADIAKIAVMPHSSEDVANVFAATSRFRTESTIPALTISMGEIGQITRLLGHRFGSWGTFATIGNAASAPGQTSVMDIVHALNNVGD